MRLVTHSLWNLVGGVVPAIAALITVPVIVSRLGEAHYGALTLVTSIVGYFALLDINASSGSVKYLAEYRARDDAPRMRQLFTLGLVLYLAIGAVGGAAIATWADELATGVFQVGAALQGEAVRALHWGALGFLFGQLQAYLQSVPQALQRFDLSARAEALFGSATSIVTLAVVLAGGSLAAIMLARAVVAAVNVVVLLFMARRLLPSLRAERPRRDIVRALAAFSGYAYLSRLASISWAHADKLLIGAYVDMRALAQYAVPFLLANRLFSLIYRLGQVMLPEASRLAALGRTDELRRTYLASARVLMYFNAAVCVLLLLFGRDLLHHWAGHGFGNHAALLLAWIALAALVDSWTNLPSLVNDGLGVPRNTGLFALARVGVGLVSAWVGVRIAGIDGVAVSVLVSSLVMTTAFVAYVHGRVLPVSAADYLRAAVLPALPLLVPAVAFTFATPGREPLPLAWLLPALALSVLALALYGWRFALAPGHRVALRGWLVGRGA
jgi:O-antigen/teichoic acid export membrane protein